MCPSPATRGVHVVRPAAAARAAGFVTAGLMALGCATSSASPRQTGYNSTSGGAVAAAPGSLDCAIDVARGRGFTLVDRSATAARLRSDIREPVSREDPLDGQPVDHLRISFRAGRLGAGAETLVPRAVNAETGTGTVWTVAAPSGRAVTTIQAVLRTCGSPPAA